MWRADNRCRGRSWHEIARALRSRYRSQQDLIRFQETLTNKIFGSVHNCSLLYGTAQILSLAMSDYTSRTWQEIAHELAKVKDSDRARELADELDRVLLNADSKDEETQTAIRETGSSFHRYLRTL